MKTTLLLLLAGGLALAQTRPDDQIQSEFQDMMALLGPSVAGETVDEEAARAKVAAYQQRVGDFLSRWTLRQENLTTGRLVLAKAMALGGKAHDAIPHFQRFLKEHPDSQDYEEALLSLGSALLDAGDGAAAVATFERLLAERPKSDRRPVATFYLGVAKERMGLKDEALARYREVASSGGESPIVADASIKIVDLLRRLGRIEEAKEALSKLLADDAEAPYLVALKEHLDQLGKEAPAWTGIDAWVQGGPVSLETLRGKVVVLNFFADRYEACQEELQRLGSMALKFHGQDVQFVALTKYYRPSTSTPRPAEVALLRELMTKLSVGFPVAVADGVANLHAYTVRGVPHTVVIGKDGRIAHIKTGGSRGNPASLDELESQIRGALGR